jgi:ABC-type glutathione transport system ATPase component
MQCNSALRGSVPYHRPCLKMRINIAFFPSPLLPELDMSSEPTIELVDIYKSFGSTRVLEGVNLTLFPGEVQSLVGENGAGKSTLVKIMAGLHLSDKGAVRHCAIGVPSNGQAEKAGRLTPHRT